MTITPADPDEIPVCEKCGQQHLITAGWASDIPRQACKGHVNLGPKDNPNPRAGQPCATAPMRGQDVCARHGGRAPQNLARGAQRYAEARALVEVNKLIPQQAEPVRDPIAVLARLAGEADTVRARIADYVNHLVDQDVDLDNVESVAAFVVLYERFLDRTARICADLVKSNYLERHAALEAAEAARVLGAVQGGLNLITDPTLRRQVAQAIADNMRKLQGPEAA